MSSLLIPAREAVLNVAQALLPVREAGPNRGRFVEAIQRITGSEPPDPWCASFVAYVGKHALGTSWPLPRTASCDELLVTTRRQRVLVDTPLRGCVFLVLRSDTDAVHTGFVLEPLGARPFRTIEGNSNDTGSANGDGVYSLTRGTADDGRRYVFIDWERLLPRSRSS